MPRSAAGTLVFLAAATLSVVPAVHSLTDYANDFLSPTDILNNNYNNTHLAQQTILQWASDSAAGAPWTVTKKPFPPPSGDDHDYMSFAPYRWPDCSNVQNTTALTAEQIWEQCNYTTIDGKLNADNRIVDNIGDFESLTDAVLYNSLAWHLSGDDTYSTRVTQWIEAWFLSNDTGMNPNLNYAQMSGGPSGQVGTHTGILDLKGMAKIVSGVLLLRQGKASTWTSDVDAGLTAWAGEYIQWLTTADIALQEKAATNNHGSFYYTQLASVQVLLGNITSAQSTIEEYFGGIYLGQIAANGDQPLETARTRPYHYRAYNLAAMITNAKIGEYVGVYAWNKTTNEGATIQTALDYAMTVAPGSSETAYAAELYPNIAAVAAKYGDPDGKYAAFLAKAEGNAYVEDANFYWNQPFSDSGFDVAGATASNSGTATSSAASGKSTVGTKQENFALSIGFVPWRAWGMLYGGCAVVMVTSFAEFL